MNDGITIKLSIFFRKNHIYCISSAKFSVCGQIRSIKFFSGFSISIFMLCWAKWPQTIDWDLFWFFHVNFITLLSQKKFIWVPNGQMRSIEIFSEFFIWILSFFWVKKKIISVPNGQMRLIKNFSDIFMSILLLCSAKWPNTIGFAVFWFSQINMSSLWS